MIRRKKLWACALALLLIAAALPVYYWLSVPVPGVSVDNAYRIRPGMSREEVEAILGGPASQVELQDWHTVRYIWTTHDVEVSIAFRGGDHVVQYVQFRHTGEFAWTTVPPAVEGAWAKLKRWLHIT